MQSLVPDLSYQDVHVWTRQVRAACEATAAFAAETKVVTEEWCGSLELELGFWILDTTPITTDNIRDVHNICTATEE